MALLEGGSGEGHDASLTVSGDWVDRGLCDNFAACKPPGPISRWRTSGFKQVCSCTVYAGYCSWQQQSTMN
jgi:hypothetical protein